MARRDNHHLVTNADIVTYNNICTKIENVGRAVELHLRQKPAVHRRCQDFTSTVRIAAGVIDKYLDALVPVDLQILVSKEGFGKRQPQPVVERHSGSIRAGRAALVAAAGFTGVFG